MIDTKELRSPSYWMCGSKDGHEGESHLPVLAADEIDALRVRLEAAEKERDNANAAAVGIALQMEKLQAEHDAMRAKIEAMERQEPVAWARKLAMGLPSFGCVTDLKYRPSNMPESAYMPLYALPGAQAQPAPSVPETWLERGLKELDAIRQNSDRDDWHPNDENIVRRLYQAMVADGLQQAPSVPHGWKLVPTAESRHPAIYKMLAALHIADKTAGLSEWDSYRAMLAAAPESKPCP